MFAKERSLFQNGVIAHSSAKIETNSQAGNPRLRRRDPVLSGGNL